MLSILKRSTGYRAGLEGGEGNTSWASDEDRETLAGSVSISGKLRALPQRWFATEPEDSKATLFATGIESVLFFFLKEIYIYTHNTDI